MRPSKRELCKVCGQEAKYYLSIPNDHGEPQVLHLFLCRHCGLLFVGNPVTDAQLAHAYGTLDWQQYYKEIGFATAGKIARALDDLRALVPVSANHRSVLDVGCGYGHFLDALSRAYPSVRAAGSELQGEPALACRARGFTVFTCDLEEVGEKFNIVALLDVAEHVPSPNRTFAACHSLLEKEGYIYIHTPRRCVWDNLFLFLARIPGSRRFSKAWLRTRVSIFHLQLWTDKALKLALEKTGFGLVYLKSEL
ncbi:MAG: class I SAM-dependent methyltransferase, partial [Deltaproteobacteria bacterium]|nr:class I SAM-dependent methyltransferase [Deltaproteobacteria bacterium]